jgi:hypothetical protein
MRLWRSSKKDVQMNSTLSTEGVSQNTPPDLSKTLRRFWEIHPYQHCDLDGIHWEYIASGQGR